MNFLEDNYSIIYRKPFYNKDNYLKNISFESDEHDIYNPQQDSKSTTSESEDEDDDVNNDL